jgi:glycosyltransferase involved in cell wall biosynthesis
LIAPDNAVAFSDLVAGLLADPERRKRMSAEARAYAMTWSAPALTGRMAALYAAVAGKRDLKAAA